MINTKDCMSLVSSSSEYDNVSFLKTLTLYYHCTTYSIDTCISRVEGMCMVYIYLQHHQDDYSFDFNSSSMGDSFHYVHGWALKWSGSFLFLLLCTLYSPSHYRSS